MAILRLRDIAHARAGDKGNRSSISVWAYEARHYDLLVRELTPETLKSAFGSLFTGRIKRYELPDLHGLNFVLDDALEGGVNSSLNLDGHGKSWSALLLGLEIGDNGGEKGADS